MKRKIKALLKNEKGMTLIELLAVIVILGIIAAIAIPAIGNIIENSRIDAVKSDAIQVINAAKTNVAAEGVPADGSLTIADLSGYIELDGTTFDDEAAVTVTKGTNSTTYTFTGTGTYGTGDNDKVAFTKATIKMINGAKKGLKDIK